MHCRSNAPGILLLVLAARTFSCQAQDGDGGGNIGDNMYGSENQVCPTFSCSKPYVPVNKWPLGITSTGCQSGGGMGMMTLGGKNDYKHVEHCCHLKNACYQLCGSNKQTCDAEMDKCMDAGCDTLSGYSPADLRSMTEEEIKKEKDECGSMKSVVALIGKFSGCKEYDMHQRTACECVDKGKVREKMERVIRNFYKKFNPEGISKVKGLVEKADGKRSIFNKILYGLVKKYPEAIKKRVLEMP